MNNTENKLIFKVIGSGTIVPRIDRASPAYLIKFKHYRFLVDCGPGTLRQLIEGEEDYKNLTGVIFSHFHPDHTADFIPLIQALDYTPGFSRKEDLLVIGPPGTEKKVKTLYDTYNLGPRGYKTIFIELNNKFYLDEGFFIDAIKGNHTEFSSIIKVGYKDNDKIKSLVYSGDTGFDPNIAEFAKNVDLLVLECSFPFHIDKHLSPEEAGEIAKMAQPQQLLLTHLYPPSDEPEAKIKDRVEKIFSGKTLIAFDFMGIII